MNRFELRRDKLRQLIASAGAEAMLVTNFTNVTYLTGFTGGDSYLIVEPDGDLLVSDPRYEQQIAEQAPALRTFIRKAGDLILDVTCRQLKKLQIAKLIIEGNSVSVNMYDRLYKAGAAGELLKGSGEVEALRVIKDAAEIETLRQAVAVAERVFTSVRAQMHGLQTEREIANELDRLTRALGGSGCSFNPIVAVGPRSALPHAIPEDRPISSSPFVLIDWGATVGGYRSDLTRVLLTSKIPAKFARVYDAVLTAQRAAIAAMKPGVLVSEIDRIAREVIQQAGMGKRFNHGLGHGIGLDIHEAPRIGKNHDRPLEAGMVVTVEPGVYYPGFGGVRIEDDVLITERGCEILSTLSPEMDANRVELLG